MSWTIRVDDFPGTKPEEFWRHNLENFKRFHDVLEKHEKNYVLGIIPRYTSEGDIQWLKKQPLIRPALHGIDHDERFPNEFRDFETEDDIVRDLNAATSRLDPMVVPGYVEDYIPPHNVIDRKTCNALIRANFRNLYGGPGSDAGVLKYAQEMGLNVIFSPHPTWYGRSDELLHRDRSHEVVGRSTQGCLTLHWTWEHNIGLENLDRFLTEVKKVEDASR